MGLSRLVLVTAILCLATGCIEIHQQFTVNPDHSARVRLALSLDPDKLDTESLGDFFDLEHELKQAESSLRDLADRIIETAAGVDVWAYYDVKRSNKGKLTLTMTGYIPDLGRFRLNPESNEDLPNMIFTFENKADDQVAISMLMEGINDHREPREKPSLAPDEIREQVQQRREQFKEEAAETRFMFDPLKISAQLRLPGRVLSTTNFKKQSPQEAQIEFTGKKFYAMLERILTEDALAKQAFAHGWSFDDRIPLPGNVVNEMMFGENAAATILAKRGSRPLFDYSKELARAKGNPAPRLEQQ